MTRINALSMPVEADFSRARQQWEDFKKWIESNPVKAPFGAAPTSGTATAGTNAPMAGAPVGSTATGVPPVGSMNFAGQVVGAPAQPMTNFSVPPQNYRIGPVMLARPFDRGDYADRLAAQAAAGEISIAQMARATSPESLRAEEKIWNQQERTRVRDETRINREAARNADRFDSQTAKMDFNRQRFEERNEERYGRNVEAAQFAQFKEERKTVGGYRDLFYRTRERLSSAAEAETAGEVAAGQQSMMRELGQARSEGVRKFNMDLRQRAQVENQVGAGIRARAFMHAERFAAADEALATTSGIQDEAQELYNTRALRRVAGVGRPPSDRSGSVFGRAGISMLLARGLAIHGYTRLIEAGTEVIGNNQRDALRYAYSSMGGLVDQGVSDSQQVIGTLGGFVGQGLNAVGDLLHRLGSRGDRGDRYYDINTARTAMETKAVYEAQMRGDEARMRARSIGAMNTLIGSSGLGQEYGAANIAETLDIEEVHRRAKLDVNNQGAAGFQQEEAAIRDRANRTRADISARFGESRDQLTYRSAAATAAGRGEDYAAAQTEMASRQRAEMFQADRDTTNLPEADRKSYMQNLRGAQAAERQAFSEQVARRADLQIREQTGMTAGAALARQGYYEAGGEAQIRAKYGAQIWAVDLSQPHGFQQVQALIGARNEELEQNKLNERRRQIGVSGEIAGLQAEFARDPLKARLEAFRTQRDAEIAGKDPASQAAKDIQERYFLQVATAKKQYGDETRNITRAISGEHTALTDYLNASSPAAGRRISDLDRMYASEINEAARLQQAGRSDKAIDYLKNTELKYDVYEKDFLNSFRAEQFDFRRMSGTNRRDQEDPGEVLKTIAQKVEDVRDAIKEITSGDQL